MRLRFAHVVMTAVLLAVENDPSPASAGPARDLLRAVEELASLARPCVPSFTAAAEAAAGRALAGGDVYLAGDKGFISEALGRAGGLMLVKALPAADRASEGDVVLIAPMPGDADSALSQRLRAAGALVIAFGAPAGFPADHALNLPAGASAFPDLPTASGLPPAAILRRVVALWAWTGEFVAACTRQGKMPVMWQSVMVPGGRERNEPFRSRGLRFHEEHAVAPIAPGKLGKAYLDELQTRLGGLRSRELRHLEEAGARVAQARNANHKACAWMMGHILPHVLGSPGEAHPLVVLPGALPAGGALGAGDVVVTVAYTGIPQPVLDAVETAGAGAVWIIAPSGPLDAARRRHDVVVDQQWRPGDAIVTVPGYDVRILPPSAVTQLTCYWAIAAEAAARVTHR